MWVVGRMHECFSERMSFDKGQRAGCDLWRADRVHKVRLIPAFFELLLYLKRKERSFSLCFRTYGQDQLSRCCAARRGARRWSWRDLVGMPCVGNACSCTTLQAFRARHPAQAIKLHSEIPSNSANNSVGMARNLPKPPRMRSNLPDSDKTAQILV